MAFELEGHEHLLTFFKDPGGIECDACDRSDGEGFSCGECKFTLHWRCVFLFGMQEILDHPSHDGHCLKLLTTGAPDDTDPKCHLCGKKTKRLLYHCSDCKLNLDIDCIIDGLCARANLNMPWHQHPLLMVDFSNDMMCEFCNDDGGHGYLCPRCKLLVHESCVSEFPKPEITHPAHVRHPLKFITNGAPDYSDRSCLICGDTTKNLLYHCDICKFNLDMGCAIQSPPPVALSDLKVHEHTLTLMARLISFVCDACGTKGDRSPYVCLQCNFMIHQKCAHLPRVINVNHHDHRVSYKYPVGIGEWRCGVCWEKIDWSYGAFSCSICPNYAIHSLCAIKKNVWDGKELDGLPEEVEDIEPFKRNDDDTVTHFAHEHNLMSLNKEGEENSLCGACVRPIGSYTFYKCSDSDCSFILHETCADLPKKKRHFLSTTPLSLSLYNELYMGKCKACRQPFCHGFIYSTLPWNFDLLCSSITVPFIHGSHDHHLLYLELTPSDKPKTCQSCGINEREFVIGCTKCDYFLDFCCATLPLTVTLPRYDDHPLTLCYGDENASGKYWCDICERETNPKNWFYTCKDCGVTLHVFCVVGDIKYAQPGGKVMPDFEILLPNNTASRPLCVVGDIKYAQPEVKVMPGFELLPNNTSSRPFCENCHSRCPGSFIVKHYNRDLAFCSYYCFNICQSFSKSVYDKDICPPWVTEHNT